jgi:hypothetical protein
MFIKKVQKTYANTGKKYFVFELFESEEIDGLTSHKFILTLGTKLELPQEKHQVLADCIHALVNRLTILETFPQEIESMAAVFVSQLENRNRGIKEKNYHRDRLQKNSASRSLIIPREEKVVFKPREGSFGDRPRRAFGDKPREDSFGDRPRRAFGDKPREDSFGERPRRAFGDKPREGSFGERPRKTFKKRF